MRNDHEETHFRETVKRFKTEIEINNSIIRVIGEIQAMNEDGILTDREFVEISNRIGW